MHGNKRPWTIETKKLISLSSLGLMLPSSIAVGILFGYILDKALGTQPWMLIVFFILGTASGIISLLRGVNRLDERENGDKKGNNNGD
jgi:ATP synthase protein I